MFWSATAFIAEVPSGALPDRFTRPAAIIASFLLPAIGFLLWSLLPGSVAFSAGFVIWGFGGALSSGAFEALLYAGLAERKAEHHFARVYGWIGSLELLCQIPAA